MPENDKKKILIAEDERAYSRALVLKLQNAGFEAESVLNGEEALEAIKKTNFDLMFCDLVMPKMNGFILLEELKKQEIKLPVIILSNLSQSEDEKKAKELGAIDFLAKSNIPIAEVILKVENFLKK